MRLRRPSRAQKFDYLGKYRYFLTMCTDKRRRVFVADSVVSPVRKQILRTFSEHRFEVLAYTFMPDHVHLLVEGSSDDCEFPLAVRLARRRSAQACPSTLRPLWQDGFHERILRGSDDPEPFIGYILNNPVKAGLAARATDYPFSWSVSTS
jgi:putative transposase